MEENTGFMDKLAQLVTDFDMANFIPELDSVIGWVKFSAQLAVLAGPLLLLILGAVYYFIPPKEANHSLGYRFYWGMGSVEAWQFTQKIAGISWMGLGLVLTVIMLLISGGYRGMETPAIVESAGVCLVWELVLIALLCIAIDVVVALRFDKDGNVRPNTVIKIPENFLDLKKLFKKK